MNSQNQILSLNSNIETNQTLLLNSNIETNQTIKKSRSFKAKLEQNSQQYGRYNGESPYQAANKAFSEIIKTRIKNNIPIDQNITFFLVETTKGSSKKNHQYIGKRVKLDEPVSYNVNNGTPIVKEYKNILRKIKKSEIISETISSEITTSNNNITINV